jgi:iron complex outermembrane receptor protein
LTAAGLPRLSGQALSPAPAPALGGVSIEDLMKMEVTSVSKKEQSLANTPAAVFVIGKEDIRRSGASNIPDLLRMVPGVDVAQINATQWAVSIRGFNAVFSNKVLVMIDGRSLYADTFSGVYWDQVNVPLENIERIEVIRGSGGTVWGANAVNGVINIITKSSADTKGGLITVGSGSKENAAATVQYGGDLGSTGAYRVFAKYANIQNSRSPVVANAADGWHSEQMGFRTDSRPTSVDSLSFQGDFLSSRGGELSEVTTANPVSQVWVKFPLTNLMGDVMGTWKHTLKGGSEISLRISESIVRRQDAGLKVADNTLDVEFQHHVSFGSRHDVVWGLDYRRYTDDLITDSPYALHILPACKKDNLYTGFLQDEIRLTNSLFFTIGSKVEHNAYTGMEFEPSAQLLWKASDRHSFWASAARAIRQPSRTEDGIVYNDGVVQVPGYGAALVTLTGNRDLQAERLNDYEVGYRSQLHSRFSIDLTSFLNFYSRLDTFDVHTPYSITNDGAPQLVIPLQYGNSGHARDWGVEAFARWDMNRRWTLSPGFSLLRMTTGVTAASHDQYLSAAPGSSPRYQPEVRSLLKLAKNLEWDSSLKYVSALPSINIPGDLRVDSRLGWRPGEALEFSIVGQNLTSGRHMEFIDTAGIFLRTEVARSVAARITWRF